MRSFLQHMRSLLTPTTHRKRAQARQAAWRKPQVEDVEGRISPTSLASDFAVLDEFGVFAMTNSKLSMTNPQTIVGGDVGLGPHATQNSSDGVIQGKLVVDPTANNSHNNNVRIASGTVTRNLQPAVNDAIDASNRVAAMHPTQTFNSISNSMTINRTTQINVINVNSVQLNGSAALTLHGGANDYFFINVSGNFAMTGTSAIKLTGGINTTHVLFNIEGTGQQVAFTGKSTGVGTFMALNRDIAVSGATVNGVLIGGQNHQIAITSGAHVQVNTPHFAAPSWL